MYLFICIHCWYLTGGCFHTDGGTVKILDSAVLLPASELLTAKSISFGLHAILRYYFQDLHLVSMTTLSVSSFAPYLQPSFPFLSPSVPLSFSHSQLYLYLLFCQSISLLHVACATIKLQYKHTFLVDIRIKYRGSTLLNPMSLNGSVSHVDDLKANSSTSVVFFREIIRFF